MQSLIIAAIAALPLILALLPWLILVVRVEKSDLPKVAKHLSTKAGHIGGTSRRDLPANDENY
jgi:hypothetical protein